MIGLGLTIAELDQQVYFTSAIDLLPKFVKAMNENRLSREIKNLTRPKLLIVDEVGYLKLEPVETSLLFRAISERHDRRGPIVMTSNKAFSSWGDVSAGDAIMASASLDRVVHRCMVLKICGKSFLLKEKRSAAAHTGIVEELTARNCVQLFNDNRNQ